MHRHTESGNGSGFHKANLRWSDLQSMNQTARHRTSAKGQLVSIQDDRTAKPVERANPASSTSVNLCELSVQIVSPALN